MKNKRFILSLIIVAFAVLTLCILGTFALRFIEPKIETEAATIQQVQTSISGLGNIHSENEATLHFQTSGKLVYLPFKPGDTVTTGQTIAQLDTYALQRDLTSALNTYRSTRDTFDQTQANSNSKVLQNGQLSALNIYNQSSLVGDQQTSAINDAAKRIIDQNQASLDNSVINVELANYALQLATLTSPISGVITAEDVTVPNQNITTATSFSVADPTSLIFKANILATDIDFVSIGSPATITLDGLKQKLIGSVVKIYPQKITLSTGEQAYTVDVQSQDLQQYGKLQQAGSVLIQSNTDEKVLLVPTWTVLSHQFVWVEHSGVPTLRKVLVGKTHQNMIEILSGILSGDKVIINPRTIIQGGYQLL